MKLDDYVRALTAALVASPHRLGSDLPGVSLVPRQPGTVSLAGRTDGRELAFDTWLRALPPGASRDVRTWSYETVHSPRFAFVPADFVALMDAQKPSEAVWRRLFELVRESAEMNGEPEVRPEGIRDALLNADDGWWGLMADQLLQEAQIECLVEDSAFVVPEALAGLFEPGESLFEEDEHFSVYLYNLRTVSVAELVALAQAQPGVGQLGSALAAETAEAFSDFADQDVSKGLEWLRTRTDAEAEETSLEALVCRAICRVCDETLVSPVIPPALAEAFGPDERDQKRAQFRSRVSGGSGFFPTPNSQPWTCYVWEATPGLAETVSEISARATFRGALVEIEDFARRNESEFAVAFRLALFALDLEPGVWDGPWQPAITARLTEAGFSPAALDVFVSNAGPTSELAAVDWPRDRLGTVLALGVADVFGGMGSWNDQGFDNYEEYARVSGALAESLRTTWEALLAPWGPHGLS